MPSTGAGRSQGRAREGRQRAADRVPERRRGIRAVGARPDVLAAAQAVRRHGDPRPPHGVVPGCRRDRAAGDAALGLDRRAGPHTPQTGPRGHRGGGHQRQLGRLHLGREQRSGRRGLTRLLHQPAGHHRDGCPAARRTAAPRPVGRRRHRRGGRAGPDRRIRQAAVDLADAGLLLRGVRTGQEEGESRRTGVARGRDGGAVPAGCWRICCSSPRAASPLSAPRPTGRSSRPRVW